MEDTMEDTMEDISVVTLAIQFTEVTLATQCTLDTVDMPDTVDTLVLLESWDTQVISVGQFWVMLLSEPAMSLQEMFSEEATTLQSELPMLLPQPP
jgi:hypothetical protein